MKKRAALLAMATLMALTPVASFAGSDNSVNKITTVKNEVEIKTGAPELKIVNDGGDWGKTETIELELENAKWLDDTYTSIGQGTSLSNDDDDNFEALVKAEIESNIVGANVAVKVERKSDTRLEVEIKTTDDTLIGTDEIVKLPLWVESDGEGEATVSISSKSGAITPETLKFANVAESGTMITVEASDPSADEIIINDIEIIETAMKSIDKDGLKYIKLELPEGFTFDITNLEVAGDLIKSGYDETDASNVKLNADKDVLEIKFESTDLEELGYKGDIIISGLKAKIGSDAKEGVVKLSLKSNDDAIDSVDLEVGKYQEYGLIVKADDEIEEVFAGRTVTLQKLVIEEDVAGTLVDGRDLYVEFPSWVTIKNVDGVAWTGDENEYSMVIPNNASEQKIELEFEVDIEAGKTGDIEAVVSSRGLDEDYKVVLEKAIAPANIEVEKAQLKAGVRKQELNSIFIRETKEEALELGQVIIELDDIEFDGEPTVEVVEGDLEIDNVEVKDGKLTFDVTEQSDEVSVIEIKDAKVEVSAYTAEGTIEAEVSGTALAQIVDGEDQVVATIDVAEIGDGMNQLQQAKFVIGDSKYMVGNEERTADVAPYIKDGRTMLPIRYVAESLGVEEKNIMWDGNTRTVTIFKGDRIAQIKIGSDKLMVNGTPITMDTVAEIKDGRTMLPVSFIAKALGADVEWDGATRTVTIK